MNRNQLHNKLAIIEEKSRSAVLAEEANRYDVARRNEDKVAQIIDEILSWYDTIYLQAKFHGYDLDEVGKNE